MDYGSDMVNIWIIYGSDWWLTKPLWKIGKSFGMMTFPIYGKTKNVPNQ